MYVCAPFMNISAQFRSAAFALAVFIAPTMVGQQQPSAQSATTSTTQQTSASDQRFPPILEDGGVSVQLIGWMVDAKPILQGGASTVTTTSTELGLAHENRPIPGVEISIPAGSGNSVRITYFRLLGQNDTYAPVPLTISGNPYSAGLLLNDAYTFQMLKGSWDFLTYTVDPGGRNLRIKTLWEVQYLRVNSVIDAPQIDAQNLLTGNTTTATTGVEKNFVLPTLGVGLEQAPSRLFRWEAKVSGFGIPHHAAILDAEANAVLRAGKFDILIGGKYYYFKTSPQSDEYFRCPLYGPSIALRWYYIRGGQ